MRINNIKKQHVYISVLAIVLLLMALFAYFHQRTTGLSIEKTLRFTYTLKNTSNEFIANADFIAMLPAEMPDAQHIISIVSTEKYELLNKDPLNQSIKFQVHNFPPFASKVISVTFVVGVSSLPKREIQDRKKLLVSEKYIEKDSTSVRDVTRQLDNKNNALFAKSAYEWLVNNIKDAGYVSDNKGAQFALEKRLGDCTEHMFAFVALARSQNIPARALAGFVVSQPASILTSADYHNWAEFYDGKWILVDSQKHVFDQHYENYIVTRIVSGEADATVSANRFLSTDSRISISF